MAAYIEDFTTAARARIRVVRERLDRTTRRERILLGGLTIAAFIYGPIMALDWRATQEDRYTQAMTERSAAQLSLASARRVAADPTSQAVLDDMNSWGFAAGNVDIARVLIEQRLFQDAQAAGLVDARIATDEAVETIGPLQWLGAEVSADLTWAGVFGFLDRLGAWPEGFQVVGFSYRLPPMQANPELGRQPGAGQVTIGLAFPVIVTQPEDAA